MNSELLEAGVAEGVSFNYNRAVSTLGLLEPAQMIAHLSGTLLSKEPNSLIVEVGGVGYEVTIPVSTFYDLEEPGSTVKLRVYTHVREDALQLYGFKTLRERELFMRLISVSGIGPKLGITLLSGMSADEMIASIRTNNLARLTLIPGVGRKTAERLVMELRDKVVALSSAELEEELGATTATGGQLATEDSMRSDVLSALLNLGYQRGSAEKAVTSALDEGGDISVESILRRSLRKLAKV
ncbi:MAG: Holliday junction branch migration protein RuvA [Pyrinomonadaceae bacterium]